MEILKGTDNFLYNTDEKTEEKIRWEVDRAAKQDLVLNFQVAYGRHGRNVNGITVGFRCLQSPRGAGRKRIILSTLFSKLLHFVYPLLLSRIMPGSCREDRMPPDTGPSPQNVRA